MLGVYFHVLLLFGPSMIPSEFDSLVVCFLKITSLVFITHCNFPEIHILRLEVDWQFITLDMHVLSPLGQSR